MASATRQTRGRNLPAAATASPPEPSSAPLSEAGDSNPSADSAANSPTPTPTPIVSMSVKDLQAIWKQIADLQAAQ